MKNKGIALLLVVSMVFTLTLSQMESARASVADQLDAAKEEQKSLESKKKKLNQEILALEEDKSDISAYIEKLDKKTDEINTSIGDINGKITNKKAELTEAKTVMAAAQQEVTTQYDAMKKRIRYMYENGNTQYAELLFSSKSLTDFLSRGEYVEKISEYDANMLKRLQKTQAKVAKQKEKIQSQLNELKDLKGELDVEKDGLATLSDNKEAELAKYEDNLQTTTEKKAQYEKMIAKKEAEVENLLLQRQKEIEKEEQAKKQQGTKTTGDSYSGAKGFRWPLQVSGRISSTFGYRNSPTAGASSYHKGIDIAVAAGTPIVATAAGKVVTATYSSSAGNYIMIYHGESTYSVYMHCSSLAVSVGTSVTKGQVIGYVGSTGISTGAHLHFGVMVNGAYVNPLNYVSQ